MDDKKNSGTGSENNSGMNAETMTDIDAPEERSYVAFISYRHKELDKKAATMIQKRIENYRVPKELQEQAGGSRLGYVFRDEDELPISSSLSDSITRALDHARFLIVICTPDLPQSKWCEQEIRYFLQTHDRDHLLAVLADGTPDISFSPLMLHEFDEQGNITEDLEPLAANIAGDDHKISRKVFQKESMRILAALIGCPFDTLWQRERRARTTRMMAVMGVVTAAVAVFAGVVLNKNAQITRQNIQISEQNEQITEHNRNLMKQASSLHVDAGYAALEGYDRSAAIEEAAEALANDEEEIYDHRVSGLLTDAMALYTWADVTTTAAASQPMEITDMEVTEDGKYAVTLDEAAYLRLLNLDSGETVWEVLSVDAGDLYRENNDGLFLAEAQGTVVVSDKYSTRAFSMEDGSFLWKYIPQEGGAEFFALSEAGGRLALLDGTDRIDSNPDIILLDTATGEVTGKAVIGNGKSWIHDNFLSYRNGYGADFTEDGTYLLCAFSEEFSEEDEDGKTGCYRYYVIDAEKAEVTEEYTGDTFSNSAAIYYGLTRDEKTGNLFCAHFSQYSGAIRTVVCDKKTGTVETVTTDHMQKGTNGTLLSIATRAVTDFLTSRDLAVICSQSTLFVFDLSDGKLRKGVEMTGDILDAGWYDRDEEILMVILSDGTAAYYDLEHTDNVFVSQAVSKDMGLPQLSQAACYRSGPLLNSAEGRWITVEKDMPGTVLVTKAYTDPELIETGGTPDFLRDAEVLVSPSGNTEFILYRDYDFYLTIGSYDPETLECREQVCIEEEFGSLSAAALDETHVAVGDRIVCSDGTAEYLEGVTAEDYYGRLAVNTARSDGKVLTYVAEEEYDSSVLRCWVNGEAAGKAGSPDVLELEEAWGLGVGGNGIVTVYGSREGEEMAFVSWDSTDGSITVTEDLHPDHTQIMLACGSATSRFVCADQSGIITVYDAKTGSGFDAEVQYAFDEIRAMSLAGSRDQYLVVMKSAERIDVIDLEKNSTVFSERIDGVFPDEYSIDDREFVCTEDAEAGQLFIAVRTGSLSESGYLVVLDTGTWTESARVRKLFAADPAHGHVFRLSSGGVSAFPWRTLEDLRSMAETSEFR